MGQLTALVTGAAGFLGRRVVADLVGRGWAVRCLVRPTTDVDDLRRAAFAAAGAGGWDRVSFVRGTLGRLGDGPAAAGFDGADVVYHLAATMRGATPVLFLGNVTATRDLVAACGRSAVRRLVLVSSLAVYGTAHLRRGDVLDETCPLDAEPHRRDPYTYSKVEQEAAAREACGAAGLELAVVRPGVIYGPGRPCITGRVGLQFGGLVVQMGGGQRLPYTFVDNCGRAVALAGSVPGAVGEAFNVVDDDPPTSRQLLRMYRKAVGGVRVLTVPRPAVGLLSRLCEGYHERSNGQLPAVLTPYERAAKWKALRYDNAKAKRALGWEPAVAFAIGLSKTFEDLQRHEHGPNSSAA